MKTGICPGRHLWVCLWVPCVGLKGQGAMTGAERKNRNSQVPVYSKDLTIPASVLLMWGLRELVLTIQVSAPSYPAKRLSLSPSAKITCLSNQVTLFTSIHLIFHRTYHHEQALVCLNIYCLMLPTRNVRCPIQGLTQFVVLITMSSTLRILPATGEISNLNGYKTINK